MKSGQYYKEVSNRANADLLKKKEEAEHDLEFNEILKKIIIDVEKSAKRGYYSIMLYPK